METCAAAGSFAGAHAVCVLHSILFTVIFIFFQGIMTPHYIFFINFLFPLFAFDIQLSTWEEPCQQITSCFHGRKLLANK